MELTRERIIKVLKGVKYPGFNRDIMSFGLVKDIVVEGSKVNLSIVLPKPDQKLQSTIEEEVRKAIFGIPGVEDLSMKIGSRLLFSLSVLPPGHIWLRRRHYDKEFSKVNFNQRIADMFEPNFSSSNIITWMGKLFEERICN